MRIHPTKTENKRRENKPENVLSSYGHENSRNENSSSRENEQSDHVHVSVPKTYATTCVLIPSSTFAASMRDNIWA